MARRIPTLLRAGLLLGVAGCGAVALFSVRGAQSGEGTAEDAGAGVRCATRLSTALLGTSATPELMASADPQSQVDALLASPEFHERFARFVNRMFNEDPGMLPAEDASYFLAKKIIAEDLPWRDLFVGKYRVRQFTGTDGKPAAEVIADAEGLGYFRSPPWMKRYAGNEEAGYRLVSAYRIMQNTIGLELVGVDSSPDIDPTAEGRMAGDCRGCHYDGPFALDLVAKVLSRRTGPDDDISFVPPDEGPQTILGGQTIANDAELITALTDSVDFKFRSCRLAFQFLYNRTENQCEAELFDECMTAFEESGQMKAALRTVLTDPGFCE
ncbi:MAG TPA: hypothetical protein VMZ28_23560 [Kofleriaceae bacterium]|nr:hypothetical protein [Kofleriaceae bacterium]